MKKFLCVIILFLFIASGCSNQSNTASNGYDISNPLSSSDTDQTKKEDQQSIKEEPNDIIEIKEKMFIAQCNDIYINSRDYLGKTIKIEGFCDVYTDSNTGKTHYGVIRNGPGCCGNDGVAGFEFIYNGEYPNANDWLEVVGTVEIAKGEASNSVFLRASRVTVKQERGTEFVTH